MSASPKRPENPEQIWPPCSASKVAPHSNAWTDFLPLVSAALALLVAYSSVLWRDWRSDEQYGFGIFVPPLIALLLIKRWGYRPAPSPPADRVRTTVCVLLWVWVLLGGFFQLVYLSSPDWRLLLWAFGGWTLVFAWSLLFLTGGWAWLRYFATPWVLLLTAIPWPTFIEARLILGLLPAVTASAVELLLLAGVAAQQVGNTIELAGGWVGIEEACSGIRSFQLALMAAIFLGEHYRLRLARRFTLVFACLFVGFLLNLARVIALSILVWSAGPESADRWHDVLGTAAMLGVVFLGWPLASLLDQSRATADSASLQKPEQTTDPVALARTRGPGWGLIAGWAATFLLCGALAEAYFRWVESQEAKRGVTPDAILEVVMASPDYRPLEIPTSIRRALRFTRARSWLGDESPGGEALKTTFMAINAVWGKGDISSFVGVHRPESCLPAGGYVLLADQGVRHYPMIGGKVPVAFKCQTFGNGRITLRVFLATGASSTGGEALSRDGSGWHRVREAFAGHRVLGRWLLQVVVAGDVSEAEAWRQTEEFMDRSTFR